MYIVGVMFTICWTTLESTNVFISVCDISLVVKVNDSFMTINKEAIKSICILAILACNDEWQFIFLVFIQETDKSSMLRKKFVITLRTALQEVMQGKWVIMFCFDHRASLIVSNSLCILVAGKWFVLNTC